MPRTRQRAHLRRPACPPAPPSPSPAVRGSAAHSSTRARPSAVDPLANPPSSAEPGHAFSRVSAASLMRALAPLPLLVGPSANPRVRAEIMPCSLSRTRVHSRGTPTRLSKIFNNYLTVLCLFCLHQMLTAVFITIGQARKNAHSAESKFQLLKVCQPSLQVTSDGRAGPLDAT